MRTYHRSLRRHHRHRHRSIPRARTRRVPAAARSAKVLLSPTVHPASTDEEGIDSTQPATQKARDEPEIDSDATRSVSFRLARDPPNVSAIPCSRGSEPRFSTTFAPGKATTSAAEGVKEGLVFGGATTAAALPARSAQRSGLVFDGVTSNASSLRRRALLGVPDPHRSICCVGTSQPAAVWECSPRRTDRSVIATTRMDVPGTQKPTLRGKPPLPNMVGRAGTDAPRAS